MPNVSCVYSVFLLKIIFIAAKNTSIRLKNTIDDKFRIHTFVASYGKSLLVFCDKV